MSARLEFPADTLPWLDRPFAEIDRYVDDLGAAAPSDYDLRAALKQWLQFGYVLLRGGAPVDLVDRYLADLDRLIAERHRLRVRINHEQHGVKEVRALPPDAFDHPHLRVMDFHNTAESGKYLALAPQVASLLKHIFRLPVVAMQSLTFFHGSEQTTHQDFPYVVANPPSHLAGAWFALEDISLDAGPLGYFSGSHSVDKFDWQPGLTWSPQAGRDHDAFARHLEAECERRGMPYVAFPARKGDVFVWHAALAHRGMPTNDRSLTRKSFVAHYSTTQACPRDRRAPGETPREFWINDGVIYGNPLAPEEENLFRMA